ncbi:hypothetical protein CPAR01_08287 [Colletotrichum paranaense]|uniref:Uncharacterized protein n=1 Tax=Colletotrichum paranaense TaxID=1914294 RepID=A0ABQ9SJV2_9PEZI|nr:uncharacterized protein CPAR01_08287 [Colletotrichum paranaense]KAK1538174.1 hypothetical protein CPAR01_08287 [Colletotrichum paranaense]
MYDLRADTRQFLLLTLRPANPVLKYNIQKRAGNWARRWVGCRPLLACSICGGSTLPRS